MICHAQDCTVELAAPKRGGRARKWCSEKCRKASYGRPCVDCGALCGLDGGLSTVRCLSCARAFIGTLDARREQARRLAGRCGQWPEQSMLDAIRSVAVDGVISLTAYRAATRASGGEIPDYQSIQKRLGWRNAVTLAGCETLTVKHAPGPRADRIPDAGVLCALQDCIAEIGHVPTYSEYEAWAAHGGGPSGTTVRNRFGGWMAAVNVVVAEGVAA